MKTMNNVSSVLLVLAATMATCGLVYQRYDAEQREHRLELLPGYELADLSIVETSGMRDYEVYEVLPYEWHGKLSQTPSIRTFVKEELKRATEKAHRRMVVTYLDREAFWAAEVAEIQVRLWNKIAEEFQITEIEAQNGLDLPALPAPY